MKALLIFNSNDIIIDNTKEDIDITNKIVNGGIEKFCKTLYETFPEIIIPLCISRKDREDRRTKEIVANAIHKHKPDFLIINDLYQYKSLKSLNFPCVIFFHVGTSRDVKVLMLTEVLESIRKHNQHLYCVGEKQVNHYVDMLKRIDNYTLQTSMINGYFTPAYCDNMPFSETYDVDVITIGRMDYAKNPFAAHKLCKDKLHSFVLTNAVTHKKDIQNKYIKRHSSWIYPQETVYGLPHTEVLQRLSRSKVYLSTCPQESWGITAMEALGCGVPVVLLTDKTGTHSSEMIPASSDHVLKVSKDIKQEEFIKKIQPFLNMTVDDRLAIYEATNKKHNKDVWKQHFLNIFQRRISDISNGVPVLDDFFE